MRAFPRPLQGFDHVQTRTILKAQIDHCERRRLFLEVFPRLGDAADGRHIEAALGKCPSEAGRRKAPWSSRTRSVRSSRAATRGSGSTGSSTQSLPQSSLPSQYRAAAHP